MKPWYLRWPFVSGVAVIVATNVFALAGVAFNRNGTPESSLTLTGRELDMPYSVRNREENSGIQLRLVWRVGLPETPDSSWFYNEAAWLDAAKLEQLGFRPRRQDEYGSDGDFYGRVSADVLLVLEMNGPTYRRAVDLACNLAIRKAGKDADRQCSEEKTERSRLFVVDAGLDRAALRAKYPDRRLYAIVRGRVRGPWHDAYSSSRSNGSVGDILTDQIHADRSMRAALDAPRAPIEATVAFGRRLEPWIVRLTAGKN